MNHIFEIPIYSMLPFVLMLAAIAVLPLFANHFWESNKNKLLVALILGIPTAIWLIVVGMTHELEHTMLFDYIPFIILLGALFIISGGIFVDGSLSPNPKTNAIILAIGAILASFMGTTGAAMLLIRPLIQANRNRKYKVHTILFFIAIVANCGGLLTPLGDPPLFMMYLRGAHFEWFLHLFPEWFITNFLLLLIYFIYDTIQYKKEDLNALEIKEKIPIRIRGNLNFLWLLGVILAVAFINPNIMPFIKSGHYSSYLRELVFLLMAYLSIRFTEQKVRASNNFNWEPIVEVAYLFLGIFITMVPCLKYLETHAAALGIDSPVLFYYATGALSSFLDNTPTAVTFHSLALGLPLQNATNSVAGIPEIFLKSISVGAVIFGSMTYIGNGPNFMVKAIAESQGITMPSFFGYMIKFSLIILLPIFIIVELICI
ncbi:sodium:proton antiporter [Bacteroidetes/Chlorobi group bacterium ChocPot_Mid]|nr:MAG: sodium:proton antiporter [Bacteroidetes/Chlorobi group bacterium ChocPot_Mid]